MLSFFLLAAKYRDLLGIVAAAWLAVFPAGHPPPPEAPEVADAIVRAVLAQDAQADLPPPPFDDEIAAALLAEFAFRESGVRRHPCANSKSPACGDHGAARGVWQLHQAAGDDTTLHQAEAWLLLLRQSASLCRERPLAMLASGACDRGTRLAAARLKAAQAAVNTWHAQQAAERPAEAAPPATAALSTAGVTPAP